MLRNPYLNRSMIRSVAEFHGRRQELDFLMGRIGAPTPQSVSVLGERRIGKSSLLWHIAQKDVQSRHFEYPERYVFVMVDFQGRQNLSEADFCRFFGEQLRAEVPSGIEVPPLGSTADIQQVVQRLTEAGLRLVCLFDEFDCITGSTGFSLGFFGFLRSLANQYPVAFVTSSRHDLPTLCHRQEIADSPFFNIFSRQPLGLMAENEVRELIVNPSDAAGLPLQAHAEDLLRLSGHWPFFVQTACAIAFDLAMESGSDEVDMVQVERRFTEEARSHFQYFWDHLGSPERKVLASIARAEEPDPAQVEALESLKSDGFVFSDRDRDALFSPVFTRFVSQKSAADGQTNPATRSTSGPARRPGVWPKRMIYGGLAALLATGAAFLNHSLSGAPGPEGRAQETPSLNHVPETNYAAASGPFRLSELHVDDVFASFYPSYTRQALGRVRITNDDTVAVDATVQFYLSDWQRRPTQEHITLAPHTTREVELRALLDPAIVHLGGNVSVETKVVVSISSGDQVRAIQAAREVTVYGRGALRWDHVGRAAAFITSTDPTVDAFSRSLLVAFEAEARSLGKPARNLIRAMVLFEALKQHGVRYVPDANTPYSRSSADRASIDHIQYPAEMLRSKAGDCDDLTALYCALLENGGVATALVDYPGHIFLIFDSGVSRQQSYLLPLDQDLYILRGDKLWIPLEITQLDESFVHAWRAGVEEPGKMTPHDRRARIIDTDQAWEDFPPAALATGNELAPPDRASLDQSVQTGLNELRRLIDGHIQRTYLDPLVLQTDDRRLRLHLIKLYLALRQYDTAIHTAEAHLLQKRGDQVATYNQLGVGHFLKGEMTRAALSFQRAVDLRPEDKELHGNLGRVLARLGASEPQAQQAVDRAGQGTDKGAAKVVDVDDFYWIE